MFFEEFHNVERLWQSRHKIERVQWYSLVFSTRSNVIEVGLYYLIMTAQPLIDGTFLSNQMSSFIFAIGVVKVHITYIIINNDILYPKLI